MTVIAKTPSGDEKKVDVKDLQFSINLYAVVVKDGKILISPQWQENGFDFPGGNIELGEEHLAGLVREVKEETGFDVKPGRVLGIFTSFFSHPKKNRNFHSMQIYYTAEIVSGELSADGFDEGELEYAKPAKFVTLGELERMQFMNSNQKPLEVIMKYLREKLSGK